MSSSNRIPVVEGPTLISGNSNIPTVVGTMLLGTLVPDPAIGDDSRIEIPHRNSPKKRGYQRNVSPKRVRELKEKLERKRVDLPTGVLLSLRNTTLEEVIEKDGDHLYFNVSNASVQVFNVVDGQHRLRALEQLALEDYESWHSYKIPFVCMIGADEYDEMQQFYVVNSTAKAVKTDLAYDLLKQQVVKNPNLFEELVAQNRDWQVKGQEITELLFQDSEVWKKRIRFANEGIGETTITSSALVNSLKPMLAPNQYAFRSLEVHDQVRIIDSYWRGVQLSLPEPFEHPRSFALQKGPGVYALHNVFGRVFEYLRAEGQSVYEPESFAEVMREPLLGLEGETAGGEVVSGAEFWSSRGGAASAYSSHAGRRVLAARIENRLPAIKVT